MKRLLFLLRGYAAVVCGAVAIASSSDVQDVAPALLPNGSFEARTGDGLPEAWEPHSWGGRAEFFSAEFGRTGGRSLGIRAREGADAGWGAIVPVRMHSRYRLSGWILTEGVEANSGRGALLNLHDLQPHATAAVTGTTDWTRVELEFETGGHETVQVNCLFGGWGQSRGTAWFDDLALELLASEPWDPRVRIDAGITGEPISKYVYGQFIEHLGRCIQGGIWAEMLEDRKFFTPVGEADSPWAPFADSSVSMSRETPFVGEHTPVVHASTEDRPVGLVQAGLGLRPEREYEGYAWLAVSEVTGPVEVRLIWGEGLEDRAVVSISSLGSEYARIPFRFTSRGSTDEGRLEIVAPGGGGFRVGTVSLMPADHVEGLRADTLALLRELDAPIYRWPGGNFVSGYDWKDGVGDRDRRPPRKNPAWTGIEANDFGLDEFLAFCRILDTEPYIAVNSGLGDVESAREEVQYTNGDRSTPMGKRRAENGHPEPYRVSWWGIGNEMYGGWQLGHMPLEEYTAKHRRFAQAMRAEDPEVRRVGVGAVGAWSEEMLRSCANEMELISEHFYCPERRGIAAHVLQIPESVRRIADAHRRYRATLPSLEGKEIRIALDEWNYWYGPHVYGELGTRYFLKDALGIAAGLNEIARQSDLFFMANYAQTVNVIGCIKTTPTDAAFATTGLVLKLYREHFGTIPVRVECSPPLDIMAALTEDRSGLTIAAVNPTLEPLEMPLRLANVTLKPGGRRWRIAGDDPLLYNEPGVPPRVVIVEDRLEGAFDTLELAPLSITLVEVPVAEVRIAAESVPGANLAPVAKASSSYISGDTALQALHDGVEPIRSDDRSRGSYGNWPSRGTQWVQYEWSAPISTRAIEVYWWNDRRGVRTPRACRLLCWDGSSFVPVSNPIGLGVELDGFNVTTFDEVTTSKLRLEIDGDGTFSTGILEWRVSDTGDSPDFPPIVAAGPDRSVIAGGKTYLAGTAQALERPGAAPLASRWSKRSGPGTVEFADPSALRTTAEFSAEGEYVLELTSSRGELSDSSTLRVKVVPAPPARNLGIVDTKRYSIQSPLWRDRAKAIIVGWIPHCIERISDPEVVEGGLNNLRDAASKLRGEPHEEHRGYVFSNAWVLNTIEAMCVALMVDPEEDEEFRTAQDTIRATLEEWVPLVLAAQEPDGFFQTWYTLTGNDRWAPEHRRAHSGYVAGYFLEAAIAHRMLTGDDADPLYLAAKELADSWDRAVGPPPKRAWYTGHQGLEVALVRFGRFVNDLEGEGAGERYILLAKFLLDGRGGGTEYDQSHLPVTQQYEAVGHAVRASYSYAAMADVAMETGDIDYHSAVASLWDNIVHRKRYVTGGIGSGETSEGYGLDYSLPHSAYCESCSSCGEIFFQHRLHLTTHEAKYVDLYETTLYNALLGSLDLEGENFFYDNPLVNDRARYPWHVCPCCVGNIPRTLLMLPTWMYSRDDENLYVNLFLGSRVTVDDVAGTSVELVQETDYPWTGDVTLRVDPAESRTFSLHVRVPRRDVSELYVLTPERVGVPSFTINGARAVPRWERGYAVFDREWQRGDIVQWTLPLPVQVIRADSRVQATRGQIAFRRGPVIYTVEAIGQEIDRPCDPHPELRPRWAPDLLGGVVVLEGTWSDGSSLTAIPYHGRANRLRDGADDQPEIPRSTVWVKEAE